MPTYNAAWFDPPAPIAYVTLRNAHTGDSWADVPMLLDSGADVTLIPQAVIERLDVAVLADKSYELAGFDGSTSQAPAVRLEMIFLGRLFGMVHNWLTL